MLRHTTSHTARPVQACGARRSPGVPFTSRRVSVRIAAPRRSEQVADLKLDSAERARLEQANAFEELVNMSKATQKVNKPQKVSSSAHTRDLVETSRSCVR